MKFSCCENFIGSADKSAYLRCRARVPYARQRSGKVPPSIFLLNCSYRVHIMKKILLFIFLILFASIGVSNADQYVPEFDKMQILRCEITETIYNNDNTQVSQTDYHRLFRLDDGTNTIYIQKERPSRIYYYGADKVQYKEQSMTDDFIIHIYNFICIYWGFKR